MSRTIPGCLLTLLAAAFTVAGAAAQDPEIIVIDPNRPAARTLEPVRPGEPQGAPPAAEAPEVVPIPAQGANPREILAGLWFRYRALVQQGEIDQADRQVATALAFMKKEGLRASPEIASALLAEAHRRLEEGDYRRAKESFRVAARFSPEIPAAHFGLASVLLRGDRDLTGAASECWAGLRAVVGDPESLYNLAGNGLMVLFLAFGAGSVTALLLLALRSVPALAHDLQERSAGGLSEEGARLAGWAVVASPILVMVPFVWSLAIWAALFLAYFQKSEKLVGAALLCALLAAGPVTHLLAWHFGTAADPAARALIQSVREGPGPQQEQALKQLVQDHPQEAIFPFLLAAAYRTAGRFDEAMVTYQRVLEIDPANTRAMVNLGNLHALRQEFAQSQSFYRKAAETDPRLALAHYNSHLAHLEAFQLEAADAELKEARRLDDALVTGFLGQGEEGRNKRTPHDTAYTAREIWKHVLRLRVEGGLKQVAAEVLTAPATMAGAAGILVALLAPGLGLAPRSGAARRCQRCGRPYCRRCQVTTKYPDVCSQCMHLFILRDGLAPGVKTKKMGEVVRYRRRIFIGARLLSIVLPGSGHVLGGRAIFGWILLVGWAAALVGVLLRGRLMVTPGAILPATAPELIVPLATMALLVWLLGNLSSHEKTAD